MMPSFRGRGSRGFGFASRAGAAVRDFLSMPGVPLQKKLLRYAILGVMAFTLFGGNRGMFRLVGLLHDRAALSNDVRELKARRVLLQTELKKTTSDAKAIERIAREQLDLVKRGETVYKFPED